MKLYILHSNYSHLYHLFTPSQSHLLLLPPCKSLSYIHDNFVSFCDTEFNQGLLCDHEFVTNH